MGPQQVRGFAIRGPAHLLREDMILPDDYEECGDCGFDHSYEYPHAHKWHIENPCSYCVYEGGQHEKHCPTTDGNGSR